MNRPKKTDKKITGQDMQPVHRSHEVYKVLLVMGSWKREFTREACKLMIAEALNQCTYLYPGGFEVTGYLVTNRRLFLVLDKNGPPLHELLNSFYEQLRKGIHVYQHQALLIKQDVKKEQHDIDHLSELFTVHPFMNLALFKLITGQKVSEPYYDPHLARLKDYIHNYNFCSALDYDGGIGPVVVKLLHHQT